MTGVQTCALPISLYLMWLGIQKFREAPVPFEEIAARTEFKDTTTKGIFMQGFLVSQTNPKGLNGASLRSVARVGAATMTSPKGLSSLGRRNPPVPHFRKLSCTRPSNGRLKTSQGSHMDLGITLTSLNS